MNKRRRMFQEMRERERERGGRASGGWSRCKENTVEEEWDNIGDWTENKGLATIVATRRELYSISTAVQHRRKT
jgi:hypothetical protein